MQLMALRGAADAEASDTGTGMAKDRKRIDEELVSIDCLAHCLKEQCGCSQVEIEREPDDPPDFWVTVDGVRFAAEVTSIVTEQSYRANALKLKRAIENSARETGALIGKFVLTLERHPTLPQSSTREWRDLVDQAKSFIETTALTESTKEFPLLKSPDGHLRIRKICSQGSTLGLCGPACAKWEGEIQDDLCKLMQDSVNKKRTKLKNKSVPSSCPRVLLLFYDAYGFGDVEDAQKALLRVDGYDWFHSVFWAASFTNRENELYPKEPGRRGAFLYSSDNRWWICPSSKST
jgi:hypothetical protein